MIAGFLSSKVSGYIAIAGAVAVLGLVWYIYNEGKTSCVNEIENAIKTEQIEQAQEVKRSVAIVKKKEQTLTTPELDSQLCGLGIVRGGIGCE